MMYFFNKCDYMRDTLKVTVPIFRKHTPDTKTTLLNKLEQVFKQKTLFLPSHHHWLGIFARVDKSQHAAFI